MARLSWWRALFYLNLVILFLVIFYKIYLNFFEQDYGAVHAEQVERIESILHGEDTFIRYCRWIKRALLTSVMMIWQTKSFAACSCPCSVIRG